MQISGVLDSHARISLSQESRGGLEESEVGSITALLTSSKAKRKVISPHTYLLRTLRTCYQSMEDSILPRFCLKWTKRGMTCGGRCLTPRISESPRTGRGYSLSQFLEAEVDGKYYCGGGLRGSGCLGKGRLRLFGRAGICSAGRFVKICRKIDGAMSGVLVALVVLGYNILQWKRVAVIYLI